ncbi:MAG: RNA polymerase sigma factor [Sinobacteraceae bacterium]|nr:RNA polymerase sigma factor [Nevskiaceae bacterium]
MATDTTQVADFATFMHAYQDMVFTTCARITGNDAQAEDIAQDVFLKAYANFEQLRGSATAGGWLKTVATRLSLNHLTRYRRRWRFFSELGATGELQADVEHTDPATPVDFSSPDTSAQSIDAPIRHLIIEQELRALPEHQRVPLVLFHFEEMSYQEIATQLRISLAKVKTDIQRARLALCTRLGRRGIGPESLEPGS